MKKFLRILVLVIGNLITLPFQLIALAILVLSKWTEEEEEDIYDFCTEGLEGVRLWINTGRFEEEES